MKKDTESRNQITAWEREREMRSKATCKRYNGDGESARKKGKLSAGGDKSI